MDIDRINNRRIPGVMQKKKRGKSLKKRLGEIEQIGKGKRTLAVHRFSNHKLKKEGTRKRKLNLGGLLEEGSYTSGGEKKKLELKRKV